LQIFIADSIATQVNKIIIFMVIMLPDISL